MTNTTYRVGVDVGGTFTDFALISTEGVAPTVAHYKVPSTPGQPAEAIARGLAGLIEDTGIAPEWVEYLDHGTTVATNQLIERKGARTGLITTAGFRDVLEIARQTRPNLYDYSVRRAEPLVPRRWRVGVPERIDATGAVLRPLDHFAVERAARFFIDAGVEAVAICFLHAYRNSAHEVEAAAIVRAAMPPATCVCTSSEVLPEFREFERTSTTCANAFLAPRMSGYLGYFLSHLAALGITVQPYTFHSNGGLMSPETARRFPVRTCLSGPAAGVVGAAAIARAAGYPNVVTFDVGGTSTDVSLVENGMPSHSLERSVAGYPVKSPTIDVHVIGAGGGSIAWLDAGGALKVGPQSAGATPGPAAYGTGGGEPTLTDANVVLQRLNSSALLGGGLKLTRAAAVSVIDGLGERIGREQAGTAVGVVQVAVASIARAIRAVSTERGHELGKFALMAYGGAGPALASEVAREVGCTTVIVPVAPGTLCARGILVSDISTDYVRTSACRGDASGWAYCLELFAEMHAEAENWLAHEEVADGSRGYRLTVDGRYVGQGFEVPVLVDGGESIAELRARFHVAHERQYGYALPEREIELVNCRLQGVGKLGMDVDAAPGLADPAPPDMREVYFSGAGWLDTPIYRRETLSAGTVIEGPAVVEELSSTTVALPGDQVRVDQWGNLVLAIGTAGREGSGASW